MSPRIRHWALALRAAVAGVALACAVARPAAAGPSWPDVLVDGGYTFGASGEPGGGGVMAALAGMWPVDDHLSFGVSAYADDIGTDLEQFIETGPPLTLLGTYENNHRFVYGAGWRLDYESTTKKVWRPFATAGWQYARVQDDARGEVRHAQSAASFGIGGGVRRSLLTSNTVGLLLRYNQIADDRVKHYLGAAIEWGWRFERKQP